MSYFVTYFAVYVLLVSSCTIGGCCSYVENGLRYGKQFAQGTYDMWKAYWDMRKANWRYSDKYFHARGNYDAAKRGPGGRDAAQYISDSREWIERHILRRGISDAEMDQFANKWGRIGGNPNIFRPPGLPDEY